MTRSTTYLLTDDLLIDLNAVESVAIDPSDAGGLTKSKTARQGD